MSVRLRVRHAEPTDAAGLHALFSQAEAYGATLQPPFPSQAAWAKQLADPPRHVVQLVAEADPSGTPDIVGAAGFEVFQNPRRRHVANIGMAVARDRWRQGIGTQLLQAAIDTAERWHGVRRLELEVYADNTAAIALYERHGFAREGLACGYALRDGVYVDVVLMARLAPG
ncbi:GNAT family N-acetyltransferase [Luteimonas abyssi]|uniref:GNAT family N-acetyltransferase n=1 Tax=Luteimonas abyssi TaxID=1247514 RepID=UPI000737C03D|nr:GNAT family N-acetyltransferase [Luteimonas abyssi]